MYAWATNVIRSPHGRHCRGQQELRDARILCGDARTRNVGVITFKIKLPSGPWRLKGRELDVLPLYAHFKGMFAINLGKVIVHLEGRTDFVGGQKRVAAKGLQALDSERGKPAVFL